MGGRVVVLGASLMDMNLRLDRLPRPGETRLGSHFFTSTGGKGANQAVAARRAGAEVTFLTAFGDDPFGREMRDRYFAEGIDLRHARVGESETSGVALILVDEGGENLIGVAMGPNAGLSPGWIDDLPAEVFEPPGVLLASLEVPLETVIRAIERAKDSGMTVVLNPAPAPDALAGHPVLARVDVLTPNRTEAEALAGLEGGDPGRLADALRALGVGVVALTLGGEGCLVVDGAGSNPISAFPAEAVDTVGAGDAFNGTLAVALAEGISPAEAATRANAAASIAVTRPGAQGALPTRAEIDRAVAGGTRS